MAVRVDEARQQRPALPVDLMLDRPVQLFGALDQLLDLAVVINDEAAEPLELAVLPDLDAVDVIDQRIGECGRRGEKRGQRDNGHSHGRFDSIVCRGRKV